MEENTKLSTLVRGTCEVFCLDEHGKVSRFLLRRRFASNEFSKYEACFIPNNNHHNMPDQLRGALIVVRTKKGDYRLGVIIKTYSNDLSCIISFIIPTSSFEYLRNGRQVEKDCLHFKQVRIPDMRMVYHKLLQQFAGKRIVNLVCKRRSNQAYPFVGMDGMISTNPEGGDILPSLPTCYLQEKIMSKIVPTPDIFSNTVSTKKKRLEKTSFIPTIYIAEDSIFEDWSANHNSDKECYGFVLGEVEGAGNAL
jgi:hypothetical protein